MLFNSPTFLFLFLPLTLLAYWLANQRLRNVVLLIASWLFYAWGEPRYFPLFLLSIFANYGFGLWIGKALAAEKPTRPAVVSAVFFNLGLLAFYKYGYFVVENLNSLLQLLGTGVPPATVHYFEQVGKTLPLGISFFTFQALSYIWDVSKKVTQPQRNPFSLALYISLFPKLISGPIVRYRDISKQLEQRSFSFENLAEGVVRFIFGLGKKVLIAAPLGMAANQVFQLPPTQMSAGLAWVGILAYTLQIYFDFSGYSDMAIGLARMFGFSFLENFNYPYLSESITDFWRRWHISLSNWFRDYVYFPLERRKRGLPLWQRYLNILIVFFLTGLWHGANWTFIVWGTIQGVFIVLERHKLSALLERVPVAVRRVYALLIIMVSWVFFRSPSLGYAWRYLNAMLGIHRGTESGLPFYTFLTNETLLAMALGLLFAFPIYPALLRYRQSLDEAPQTSPLRKTLFDLGLNGVLLLVLFGAIVLLAGSTQTSFIYFRF